MMTVEEAIDELKRIRHHGTERLIKALEVAISALEKQIPKKPTHEATRYINNTCPYCKNVIDNIDRCGNRILEPFCKFCGQAIDWSEENDE